VTTEKLVIIIPWQFLLELLCTQCFRNAIKNTTIHAVVLLVLYQRDRHFHHIPYTKTSCKEVHMYQDKNINNTHTYSASNLKSTFLNLATVAYSIVVSEVCLIDVILCEHKH